MGLQVLPVWHTTEHPFKLLDEPIVPEKWIGGLVMVVDMLLFGEKGYYYFLGPPPLDNRAEGTVPVYPPRGWAGKSETELWRAMCGNLTSVEFTVLQEDKGKLSDGWDLAFKVTNKGLAYLSTASYEIGVNVPLNEPTVKLLNRWYNNTMVLARRLSNADESRPGCPSSSG